MTHRYWSQQFCKEKYPLVDKSSLSLPLAQGICVLWTPSKAYKRLALPVGGGVCSICLAKDCDSLPSPEVHVALPPVCTQRKIKLAFPCLWNFMLTDLSGMSLSSLWQPLISQACCVSRLTSYCMCIQTDYKFPTLPPFCSGYYLWQMSAMKWVHFFPFSGSRVSSHPQRHTEANLQRCHHIDFHPVHLAFRWFSSLQL